MSQHRLPFGQYAGHALRDVPADYMNWLLRTCKLSHPLRQAIRQELVGRNDGGELPPEPAPKPLACPDCGSADARFYWTTQAGGRRAIRADCAVCGAFIRFAP
jgi:hypothetical protein